MHAKRSDPPSALNAPRRPRRIHEEGPGKLPELAGCPGCGASYRNGRWTWQTAPVGSYEHLCPACERIATNYPAATLHVEGDFVASHRDDLVALVRNVEARERAEHPLKRIVAIADAPAGFVVTATDAKLVETFGRALQRAYAGYLSHPSTTSEPGPLVRVRWTRD